MSASRVAALRKIAAQRTERSGDAGQAAWVDTLAEFQLDWDVNQILLGR